ncbi:MAG: hypothetical protein DRH37_05870 [Deltaproteobacteria bacterium]|nr:MAG: hypothetical protein DRH37_05870 [Deltaproteobacteria bacterium]
MFPFLRQEQVGHAPGQLRSDLSEIRRNYLKYKSFFDIKEIFKRHSDTIGNLPVPEFHLWTGNSLR